MSHSLNIPNELVLYKYMNKEIIKIYAEKHDSKPYIAVQYITMDDLIYRFCTLDDGDTWINFNNGEALNG